GRDAVEPRVGDFALGPFAQILHLGKRAQQPVFRLGKLAVERSGRFGVARCRSPSSRSRCLGLSGRLVLSASGLSSHVSSHSFACHAYQGTGGKNQAPEGDRPPPDRVAALIAWMLVVRV